MFTLRAAAERGHTKIDWLNSYHTFSFDQFYDEKFTSFGPLRVINEDWVKPGAGFPTHPHRDMEIITYVIEGELQHRDSLGTGSIIKPGEIQKMSAGSGILHSEFNPSKTESVHLLQIWIVPDKRGLTPKYEQQQFELESGVPKLLGSRDGSGLVHIQQAVNLYALKAQANSSVRHTLEQGSSVWLQIVKGNCLVDSQTLLAGDGAAIGNSALLDMSFTADSELLFFEILK